MLQARLRMTELFGNTFVRIPMQSSTRFAYAALLDRTGMRYLPAGTSARA
jgi:hypothetical protein